MIEPGLFSPEHDTYFTIRDRRATKSVYDCSSELFYNIHSSFLRTIESILNDDEQLGTFIGVVEEEEVNMPQEFWNAVENWESLPEKKKPEMIQSIAKKFVVDGMYNYTV